jgi:hypothetical protein
MGYEKAVSNFVKLAANTNNNTLRSNQLQIGNSSEEKKKTKKQTNEQNSEYSVPKFS